MSLLRNIFHTVKSFHTNSFPCMCSKLSDINAKLLALSNTSCPPPKEKEEERTITLVAKIPQENILIARPSKASVISEDFDDDYNTVSILAPNSGKHLDFSSYAPELVPTFNLAAYANNSPTLQKLIELGTNLHTIERKSGIPQFILGLDFERDMRAHILFLTDAGVSPDDLGHFLTKNPLIFKEDLENLEKRVSFLLSQNYDRDTIKRIVTSNPYWLMFSVDRIEKRLDFFKEHFCLSPLSTKKLVCLEPRLITYNINHVKNMSFSVREEMGFETEEIKSMVLTKPRIWMTSNRTLLERFHLVHNEMKVTHAILAKQPHPLLCRTFRTRQRHLFLKSLGIAQYDPTLPNYVSMRALISGTDADFAVDVAGSPLVVFKNFLKTL